MFSASFNFSGPYPELAVAAQCGPIHQNQSSVEDSSSNALEEGILWGVPKNRRSRERRLIRKFGSKTGHHKMLPVLKLLTCDSCGHPHEPGRLCRECSIYLVFIFYLFIYFYLIAFYLFYLILFYFIIIIFFFFFFFFCMSNLDISCFFVKLPLR